MGLHIVTDIKVVNKKTNKQTNKQTNKPTNKQDGGVRETMHQVTHVYLQLHILHWRMWNTWTWYLVEGREGRLHGTLHLQLREHFEHRHSCGSGYRVGGILGLL